LNAAQAGRLSKRAIGWVMFMQSRLHLTFSRPREAKKALHLALSVDSEDQTLNANCIQALSDVRASLSELPQAGLFQKMLNAGFSSLLAHQILSEMPAGKMAGSLWVKQVLKCNLQVVDKANDVIVKGGAYALIGSTGVGKTSTIAKLAARAIVKYGADTVALLTTDSYRIGAYEQLKTYGKILGVSVHAVKDPDDLRLSLSALRHKRLVLIDTAGTGQRDERVGDQNEMFEATDVQCLLLLNATSSRDTLEDVVRRFSSSKIVGCILTKLDEAINLGSVLDVVIRHRLVLHYMANGQHVPEDLHPINFNYLLRRALTPAKEKTPPTWHELNFPKLVTGSSTKKVLCTLK
jgi:flagellar biosynthesis protein FlhF